MAWTKAARDAAALTRKLHARDQARAVKKHAQVGGDGYSTGLSRKDMAFQLKYGRSLVKGSNLPAKQRNARASSVAASYHTFPKKK